MYRCLKDVDDEVRDRTTLYLRMLKNKELINDYMKNGMSINQNGIYIYFYINIFKDTLFSLYELESGLLSYFEDPQAYATQFDSGRVQKASHQRVPGEPISNVV